MCYTLIIQHYIGDEDKEEYSFHFYITELHNRKHEQKKKNFKRLTLCLCEEGIIYNINMAIANLKLPSFPVFILDDYTTISTCWKKYKRRFENFVAALNVTDDRQKKALLRNYIGEEAYQVYENLTTGAEDETYEAVITFLDGHFAPKSNISYERYLFRNFKQNPDERIHQFYVRVKQQALKCDFGDTNSEIKPQLILVTNGNKLRRYCFRNLDITMENLLTYAKTLEDTESQAEEIEEMPKDVEDVNFTRKSKKQNKADEGAKEIGKGGYFGRKSSQDSTQKTCFRCGGGYPHTAHGYPHTAQCPAIGKTCSHCHKKITSKEFADKIFGRILVMGNH